ncbi:YhdP family protein [Halofilum ochraceum]|uniref:YhdP family protein n=1 Tax=Halofilum ochraceum TaxID=1611323 RepID=UPI0008310BD7|nr:YhdP family protein [Halofilum ochraceum]
MRSGWGRLRRWLGGTVAFALIAAAVLLTVLRLALPFAAEYRAELEARVADYLDTPVSIGSMEVEWHGLGPRLRLVDLRLEGPPPARQPLRFDEAFVDIGIGPGIGGELPMFIRSMSLVGLNLEIELNEDGQLAMFGQRVPVEEVIPKGETPPPFVQRIGGWLLGTGRLQLLDASIDLVSVDGDRSRISDIDLRLANDEDHHRAALSMQLPSEWGESIDAVFDVTGAEIGDWAQWEGRIWVDAQNVELRRWSGLYPELPIHVRDGRASFATWIDFGNGRLGEVALHGDSDNLAVAGGPMEVPVAFERLAGRLRWHGQSGGDWQLDVGDLKVRRGGRAWPESGFSVARESNGDGARWRLGADFLRIEDSLALARLTPLANELPRKLRPLAPGGDLYDLQAAGAASEPIALRARFEDVDWTATGDIPGVRGVDGRLEAGGGGARIDLAAREASLDAPRFMAAPLDFARFTGRVGVTWPDDGVRIRGQGLRAENADGTASGRVEAFVPGDGSVHLDIEAGFDNVPVPAVTRYIPAREIPREVMSALDRTLQAGLVEHGELRLEGRARDFPYRDGNGTFTVDLQARNARIDYAPGWPSLDQVSGRVRFDGPSMRIDAEAARLFGIRSRRLTARIPDLEEGRLAVSAEADAPIADLIRLVNESPLADELGRLFAGARGDGEAPFRLDLEVPLRAPEQTTVAGRVALSGDSLVQPRFDLDMRDLDGALRFTRRGVEMDGLGATVRGQRLTVDAEVEEGPDPDNVITASGMMEPQALLPHLSTVLAEYVTGAAPWRINIRIPSGDDEPIMLSGDSALRGTAIDVPSPLGKAPDQDRRLAFSLPLEDDAPRVVRLEYGDELRALVELLEGRDDGIVCERAAVHFGDGAPRLRKEPGLYMDGTLRRLDLRGWARTLIAEAGGGTSSSAASRPAGADGFPGAPGFGGADLDVQAARYDAYVFSDARLRTRREGGDWLVELDSDEVSGQTRIPANVGAGEPIRVRYDWIDLGLLAPEGGVEAAAAQQTEEETGFDGVDPASMPPLDVRIDRLKTRNALLNDITLVTSPTSDGVTIHRVGFDNEHLRLEGQGRWRGDPRSRTSVRLQLRSGNFGAGLSGIGYGGALVEGDGEVTANLDWNGPPWAPTLENLEGYAQLQLEDGVIPEVDPGPARLLGLVSLRALPQLLSMDFGTLVQRGYAFDTINGRIDFDGGNAFSRGLEVDGPVGKMIITGRTGLVARDYDQTVAFQPELSSSLPVIGALTGGPVTGLAVALVQGVLRNIGADVEEASEFRYSLTGTWADPKVQLVNRAPENTNTYEPSQPGRQGR